MSVAMDMELDASHVMWMVALRHLMDTMLDIASIPIGPIHVMMFTMALVSDAAPAIIGMAAQRYLHRTTS